MSIDSTWLDVDTSRLELESLTTLHWIGIYLAGISTLVHLVLAALWFPYSTSYRFFVVSGGFIGGLILLFINYRRRQLYLAGVGFTVIQIVGWYVIERPAGVTDIGPTEVIDKIAQVALIGVLITLYSWDW